MYTARAFDGNRWVRRIAVETLEEARVQARDLMSLIDGNAFAWLLIEIQTDLDGRVVCERQWIGTPRGYVPVAGRDGNECQL